MDKGIIVVDIPQRCGDCSQMVYYDDISCYVCEVGRDIGSRWGKVDTETKPAWCPIKSMPDKIVYQTRHSVNDEQFAAGWNACIDKMLESMCAKEV